MVSVGYALIHDPTTIIASLLCELTYPLGEVHTGTDFSNVARMFPGQYFMRTAWHSYKEHKVATIDSSTVSVCLSVCHTLVICQN